MTTEKVKEVQIYLENQGIIVAETTIIDTAIDIVRRNGAGLYAFVYVLERRGKMTDGIEFKLGKEETLFCDSCFKYLRDQKVHFHLNADGASTNEVMCDACWKEEQKEVKEKWAHDTLNRKKQ